MKEKAPKRGPHHKRGASTSKKATSPPSLSEQPGARNNNTPKKGKKSPRKRGRHATHPRFPGNNIKKEGFCQKEDGQTARRKILNRGPDVEKKKKKNFFAGRSNSSNRTVPSATRKTERPRGSPSGGGHRWSVGKKKGEDTRKKSGAADQRGPRRPHKKEIQQPRPAKNRRETTVTCDRKTRKKKHTSNPSRTTQVPSIRHSKKAVRSRDPPIKQREKKKRRFVAEKTVPQASMLKQTRAHY